jgi:predicted transcriptional regulator
MSRNFLVIDPAERPDVLHGLASRTRARILRLLHRRPGVNVNDIEVAIPIGLYTSCKISAPCGLCSPKGVIGLLDVPGTFLDPDRMNAGLMWFTRGFVEYQFPNNARQAHHGARVVV